MPLFFFLAMVGNESLAILGSSSFSRCRIDFGVTSTSFVGGDVGECRESDAGELAELGRRRINSAVEENFRPGMRHC